MFAGTVYAQRLGSIIENHFAGKGVIMQTVTNLPTIDILDATIAIQSHRTEDTCDVVLSDTYAKADIGIIRQAARRCGSFVTFDYVDGDEIRIIEVY